MLVIRSQSASSGTSKSFEMQRQTLGTLRDGQGDGPVFNKLRMTVFPKWYEYNHANPVETGTAYAILYANFDIEREREKDKTPQKPSTLGWDHFPRIFCEPPPQPCAPPRAV